ncbi:MAG: phosphoribosyltransferase family protein [Thermoprotei archaeon]|jgi:adenine phosphoribosyltransferase
MQLPRVILYQGQKEYITRVGSLERKLPIVQVSEGLWIASIGEIVLGDIDFVEEAGKLLAKEIKEQCNPEVLIAPEAKAFPLAHVIARELGHKFFAAARKGVKGYMSGYISIEVQSITTAEKQRLVLDDIDVLRIKGKKVCLLDDIVSTGGTMKALQTITEKAGGIPVCKAAIWLEGPWWNEKELIYLTELPVFMSNELYEKSLKNLASIQFAV